MDHSWINEYCLKKPGVEKDFKIEWGWDRYMLEKKLFCAICTDKIGRPIVTVKCEPLYGTALREQYEAIIPGYYMNKVHWNSVYLDSDVPNEVIKKMINMSYELILNALPKKVQRELLDKTQS